MKRMAAVLIALAALGGCAGMSSPDSGWTTLLDGGKGFENWDQRGVAANWRVVDGVVQADKGEKGNSFLMTRQSYGDFMLRVEFWSSDDANSGGKGGRSSSHGRRATGADFRRRRRFRVEP